MKDGFPYRECFTCRNIIDCPHPDCSYGILPRPIPPLVCPKKESVDLVHRPYNMRSLLLVMLEHYGFKEIPGDKHNEFIVAMFKEIGFEWVKDDETAWCSAVLNYFCLKVGYERSKSLAARSWLKMGTEVFEPKIGEDIVIFWREAKDGPFGHVGLYISTILDIVYVLGGNQNNQFNISGYPKERVLGYRKLRKL